MDTLIPSIQFIGLHRRGMIAIQLWIEKHLKYIFTLPSVLFVLIMIVFPVGYTAYLSFLTGVCQVLHHLNGSS